MFGETTLALRAWMREHGVARATDDKTPEDHIGLMLALMSHLCRTQPESLGDYLCGHLLTWAPHYLEELASVPAIPSTAALPNSRAPRFSASRISAGFP